MRSLLHSTVALLLVSSTLSAQIVIGGSAGDPPEIIETDERVVILGGSGSEATDIADLERLIRSVQSDLRRGELDGRAADRLVTKLDDVLGSLKAVKPLLSLRGPGKGKMTKELRAKLDGLMDGKFGGSEGKGWRVLRRTDRDSDSTKKHDSDSDSASDSSSSRSSHRVIVKNGKVIVDEREGDGAHEIDVKRLLGDLGGGVDAEAMKRALEEALKKGDAGKGDSKTITRRIVIRDGEVVEDTSKEGEGGAEVLIKRFGLPGHDAAGKTPRTGARVLRRRDATEAPSTDELLERIEMLRKRLEQLERDRR